MEFGRSLTAEAIYGVNGRKEVINGIDKALKYLEDDEMVELSLCVLAKLKELTDHEFMKMEFVAAE